MDRLSNALAQIAAAAEHAEADPIALAVAQELLADRAERSLLHRGLLAEAAGDWAGALAAYRTHASTDAAAGLHFIGRVLARVGAAAEALTAWTEAALLRPGWSPPLLAAARLLPASDGIRCLSRILALTPIDPQGLRATAALLHRAGRPSAAIVHYRRAIVAAPAEAGSAILFTDLAAAALTAGSAEVARRAIALGLQQAPLAPALHANAGALAAAEQRADLAVAAYLRARLLAPEAADMAAARAAAMAESCREIEAARAFAEARCLAEDPVPIEVLACHSSLAPIQRSVRDAARQRRAWRAGIRQLTRFGPAELCRGLGDALPFRLAYLGGAPQRLLGEWGRLTARAMAPVTPPPRPAAPRRGADRRRRVGIVSAFFRRHSVWTALTRGWLERLDRRELALYGYAVDGTIDEEARQLTPRLDRLRLGPAPVEAIAQWIRDDGIEVLLYPELGMHAATYQLAAMRLARIQIAAWGHPVTSGLPTIDYYASGAALEPDDADHQYTERLIRLPGLGSWYPRIQRPAGGPARRGGGPPILLFAQLAMKWPAGCDRLFGELARRLPNAQFLFFADPSPTVEQVFRNRLAAAGLPPERTRVLGRLPEPDYLALLGEADVYLDAIGFSGINTGLQAMAAGLPVVTCRGPALRGRLAAGALELAGFGHLVAASPAAYVDVATALAEARDPALRNDLAAASQALFEDDRVTVALQALLTNC